MPKRLRPCAAARTRQPIGTLLQGIRQRKARQIQLCTARLQQPAPHCAGNFESQLGLALLNEKDKHYTEALDGINRLIEQYPDNPIGYAARGGIEAERKMFMLAEYDFTEAIVRSPDNQDYILQRIEVYIQQRKFSQAKRDLDLLVKRGVSKPALKDFYDRLK